MTTITVTSGLQLILEAAEFISCKFLVIGSEVTFETELSSEECVELEMSGAEFIYTF